MVVSKTIMHDYEEEGGGLPYDGRSKWNENFIKLKKWWNFKWRFFTTWNSFATIRSEYLVAAYFCHINSFYSYPWFSIKSITCYLIVSYKMFFISDVSLIYINVNTYQGDVIFKTILDSKLFNLYAVFR